MDSQTYPSDYILISTFYNIFMTKKRLAVSPNQSLRFHYNKILTGCLCLFLTAPAFAQTTVAVVRDKDTLVLATDSKGTSISDPSQAIKWCKIGMTNGFIYAFAGHMLVGLHGATVNASQTAAEASRKQKRLKDGVVQFERLIVPQLNRLIQEMQKTESLYFRENIAGKVILEAVFASFEADQPIYYLRDFKASESLTTPASVQVVSFDDDDLLPPKMIRFACRGMCEEVQKFISQYRNLNGLGLIELARFIVAFEVIAQPIKVAPPIDVLLLDKTGVRWIQRKAECEDKDTVAPIKITEKGRARRRRK